MAMRLLAPSSVKGHVTGIKVTAWFVICSNHSNVLCSLSCCVICSNQSNVLCSLSCFVIWSNHSNVLCSLSCCVIVLCRVEYAAWSCRSICPKLYDDHQIGENGDQNLPDRHVMFVLHYRHIIMILEIFSTLDWIYYLCHIRILINYDFKLAYCNEHCFVYGEYTPCCDKRWTCCNPFKIEIHLQ